MPSQTRVCTARGGRDIFRSTYYVKKYRGSGKITLNAGLNLSLTNFSYLPNIINNDNCWLSQLTLDFMILRTAFAYKLLLAVQAFVLFAGKMNTRSVQTVTEPVLYCPHCNSKLSPSRHSNGGKQTIIPALAPSQLTAYNYVPQFDSGLLFRF